MKRRWMSKEILRYPLIPFVAVPNPHHAAQDKFQPGNSTTESITIDFYLMT